MSMSSATASQCHTTLRPAMVSGGSSCHELILKSVYRYKGSHRHRCAEDDLETYCAYDNFRKCDQNTQCVFFFNSLETQELIGTN